MTNSKQFLQIATSIADAGHAPELGATCLTQARRGFGEVPESIDVLLDRKNWTVAKPQVRVFAKINQKSSFVVRWVPTIGSYDVRMWANMEFEHYFVREVEMAEGLNSSVNLLMWFREPPLILPSSRDNNSRTAVLCIAAGLKARYEEFVDQLRQHLLVTSATSLATLTEGDRVQYQFGPEGRQEHAELIAKGLTAPT
jgi:hypothetical protein